jgi:hypothetical protein
MNGLAHASRSPVPLSRMVTPYANYKNRDYRAPGNIMPVTNVDE